jgi:hypothetical protein
LTRVLTETVLAISVLLHGAGEASPHYKFIGADLTRRPEGFITMDRLR